MKKIFTDVQLQFVYMNMPKRVRKNSSGYQDVYEDGMEIEMLKIIGNSLNLSLDIGSDEEEKYRKSLPAIYGGGYKMLPSMKTALIESSRNYLTVHTAWYMPCALKHQKMSYFFNIFSVDMWIYFALSLVLAVITVRCISKYAQKTHLHESNSYSTIFIATANTIAVLLSVSVNTQPRSAPLRLFFFCWVCCCVAISTVIQAYLTKFLIEPGYKKRIKTVEQMLTSDMKFGFSEWWEIFFTDTSSSIDLAIFKNAVRCSTYENCLNWVIHYQNFSTILSDLTKELWHAAGLWNDENNRLLACELEYGVAETSGIVFFVSLGSPILEFLNNVMGHIIEGEINIQLRDQALYKAKLDFKFKSPAFTDTDYAINISHLQTAFHLLFVGYVMSVVCFVSEIVWHRYR